MLAYLHETSSFHISTAEQRAVCDCCCCQLQFTNVTMQARKGQEESKQHQCCIFVIFHFLISLENTNTWSVNNLLWLVPTCVKCSCWTNRTGNFSPFVRQRNQGSKWAGKQDPTMQFIPRLSTQRRNQKYLLIISFFVSFFILSFFSFFWICRLYAFLL